MFQLEGKVSIATFSGVGEEKLVEFLEGIPVDGDQDRDNSGKIHDIFFEVGSPVPSVSLEQVVDVVSSNRLPDSLVYEENVV